MIKKISLILFIFLSLTSNSQEKKTQSTMKKENSSLIRNASEVKGKRTVFTEITINASPEMVRSKFLEFEKWREWCAVIPKIKVIKGDINNLETKPKLELWVDMEREKDPQKAPSNFTVKRNDEEAFIWGVYQGALLKIEHVFIFSLTKDGKGTHLIHYERMAGLLGHIFMTEKLKGNLIKHYNLMNESLKKISENTTN